VVKTIKRRGDMQYSVVRYSEIKENSDFRIDAEYYYPEFIRVMDLINSKKNTPFINYSIFIKKGCFDMSPENYSDHVNAIPFIRSGDMKNIFFNDDVVKITQESHKKELKTELGKGDLILSKVGTIGDMGINLKWTKINCSQNTIAIKIKDGFKKVSPFLAIYINCYYGKSQLNRSSQGQVQDKLTLEDLKNLLVVNFGQDFQSSISSLVKKSFELSENSKSLYNEAENLLLEELSLKDWKPKHQLSYIKNYSDTQKAERFDAEYFQPQYDAIIEKIKSYNQKQGINKEIILDDVVKWSKGVEVGSEQYLDEGFDFIRISDFSTKGISETSKKISKELFAELKGKYSPRKGDILFTKDGTIGLTYLVDQNQDSIVSGAFLKLRPKIEAEYLALVLNSVICKKQIEMMSGGAIIAHLKPSDAMNLQIPILSPESQKQISSKIIESKKNNEQSKSLLEIAKKAVEMAIESNEQKATNWIDQELEKLGVRLGKD
jgi:hypothetical protein